MRLQSMSVKHVCNIIFVCVMQVKRFTKTTERKAGEQPLSKTHWELLASCWSYIGREETCQYKRLRYHRETRATHCISWNIGLLLYKSRKQIKCQPKEHFQ